MKLIPSHPFHVRSIRVAFAGEPGPIRIRLMRSFGRSYPDLDAPDGDLLEPPAAAVYDEGEPSAQGVGYGGQGAQSSGGIQPQIAFSVGHVDDDVAELTG